VATDHRRHGEREIRPVAAAVTECHHYRILAISARGRSGGCLGVPEVVWAVTLRDPHPPTRHDLARDRTHLGELALFCFAKCGRRFLSCYLISAMLILSIEETLIMRRVSIHVLSFQGPGRGIPNGVSQAVGLRRSPTVCRKRWHGNDYIASAWTLRAAGWSSTEETQR
jgi:hypothetical protein